MTVSYLLCYRIQFTKPARRAAWERPGGHPGKEGRRGRAFRLEGDRGMRLTGSEIFLKCLKAEGVHTIFGHPGGVVLHAYHLLLDYPIRHILCRHEQVAVHAV